MRTFLFGFLNGLAQRLSVSSSRSAFGVVRAVDRTVVAADFRVDGEISREHRRRSSVKFRGAQNFCPKNMY